MTETPQDPSAQSDQPQQPYAAQPPPKQYNAPPPPQQYNAPPPPQPMGQVPGHSPQGQAPVSPSDARMYSMFAHIGGLLTAIIVPLVIYLIFKDRDPFIRRHAAQALNFQIIIAIAYFASSILIFVIIGFITYPLAVIASIALSIIAAIAANKGEEYTYPLVPKMVS